MSDCGSDRPGRQDPELSPDGDISGGFGQTPMRSIVGVATNPHLAMKLPLQTLSLFLHIDAENTLLQG